MAFMKGPLNGIRVLTVEGFIAGPMASMWLADAGAEVVKVEAPGGGDTARNVAPIKGEGSGSQSLSFIRANRNKRSITLDLKSEEGRRTFLALLRRADVFLENARPASLPRLGLTYEELRKHNPRLIYAAVSGFGLPEFNEGDLPYLTSFDIVAQAMGGLLLRPEGAESGAVYPGYPLADIFAAANVQSAIYQALFNRERTGEGAYVDVSMFDGAIAMNELAVIMHCAFGHVPAPGAHSLGAPFGAYTAADGQVVLGILGQPVWVRFARTIGRFDLVDTPEYATGILRHEHRATLDPLVNKWMSQYTVTDVLKIMGANDIPAAPVWNVDEVVKLDYVRSRRMLLSVDDPAWGPVTVAGNPLKSSLMSDEDPAPAPLLGADTADVLREWLGPPSD
ncbi:CoA transferase [Acidothermaceae bacterium B102]|nr:CoA transferase [Acidothermaceae bacterium B102]